MILPLNSFLFPVLSQNRLQALASICHVNITPIYSITLLDGKVFQICTESYVSHTLRNVINELLFLECECSVKLAASILIDALEALAYLVGLDKVWGLGLDVHDIDWLDMLCVDDRGRWKIIIHKVSAYHSYQSKRSICTKSLDIFTPSYNHHGCDEVAQDCLSSMRSLALIILNLLASRSQIDLEKGVALQNWNEMRRNISYSKNNYDVEDLELFISALSPIWSTSSSRFMHPYCILTRLLPIRQAYMQSKANECETSSFRHKKKLRYSPLMLAVVSRDYELVQKNISYAGCRTKCGMTALMMAARDDFVEAVRILIPYEAQYRTFLGTKFESRTALMFATHSCSYSSMHILYEYEAGIANVYGATSLMRAAQSGDCTATKMLMQREVKMANYAGLTALMNGAAKGFTEIVSLLIPYEAGMVTNDKYEWGKGQSALSLAVINADKKIVLLLYDIEQQLIKSQCTLTSGKTAIEELIDEI